MKSTSVRGTPVRSIKASNSEGMRAGKPANFNGAVNKQFEGDQSGNRQTGLRTGTPYESRDGNGPETRRVASQGKYGMVESNGQGDMNNPDSNGNGVLLDGISEARDLLPTPASNVMDSPVPSGAQMPVSDATEVLANLRSGVGKQWGPNDGPGNNFQKMGGVMSRGMSGVDKPTDGEDVMLEDDTLKNMGKGGAVS